MKNSSALCKHLVSCLLVMLLLASPVAFANDHGGGASGPTPMKFVVNLGDPMKGGKYLQVEMVFEAAEPEAEHLLGIFRPRIQHALILLLSGSDSATLLTLKGKKDLMENIIETANHVLHETEKTGIKEVYFTSFIIQ